MLRVNFQFDQRVWSPSMGWGGIEQIKPKNKFPIVVRFDIGRYKEYGYDGVARGEVLRTLFFQELEPTEESLEPPIILQVDDIVWVEHADYWARRHFSRIHKGEVVVFSNGTSSKTAIAEVTVKKWRVTPPEGEKVEYDEMYLNKI